MAVKLEQILHLLSQSTDAPLEKVLSVRVAQIDTQLIEAAIKQVYGPGADISSVVRDAFREGIEAIIKRHLQQKELPLKESKTHAFPKGRWL